MMHIHCTKKLLDHLKLKPEIDTEGEALFSWNGNLISINRRNAVVLVNEKNRYIVVLYGLKANDFKKFNEIAIQAIRETFREEGIKDEVIEKYLLHSKEIVLTKTTNRTSVARLNKACENVFYFAEYLESESIFNTKIGVRISRLIVGDGKNKYINPNEEMYKDLESFAGEPIFSIKSVQLKVTLKLEEHQVWRRIIVPLNMTFEDLHETIQEVFGWSDSHLHEFYIYERISSGDSGYKPKVNIVCSQDAFDFPNEIEMIYEKNLKLSDYIPTYSKFQYIYDFGDHWEHEIEVEKTIDDYDKNYPFWLDGAGKTPPEDVGGEGGYVAFLEIIANPTHPDYQHMVKWGDSQGYPKNFDIERVNRFLKNK